MSSSKKIFKQSCFYGTNILSVCLLIYLYLQIYSGKQDIAAAHASSPPPLRPLPLSLSLYHMSNTDLWGISSSGHLLGSTAHQPVFCLKGSCRTRTSIDYGAGKTQALINPTWEYIYTWGMAHSLLKMGQQKRIHPFSSWRKCFSLEQACELRKIRADCTVNPSVYQWHIDSISNELIFIKKLSQRQMLLFANAFKCAMIWWSSSDVAFILLMKKLLLRS